MTISETQQHRNRVDTQVNVCVCVKLYEDKSIAVNDNLQDIFLRCWCDSTRTTNNIVHVGGFFDTKSTSIFIHIHTVSFTYTRYSIFFMYDGDCGLSMFHPQFIFTP